MNRIFDKINIYPNSPLVEAMMSAIPLARVISEITNCSLIGDSVNTTTRNLEMKS